MKFALPIKFFQAGCVAAAIGFGMIFTNAQASGFTFPTIGTVQKVGDSANTIGLLIVAYHTNNMPFQYFGGEKLGPWTNKYQIDQIIATQITNQLSSLVASMDQSISKSNGVYIDADVFINGGGQTSQDALYYYGPIQLTNNQDG